MTSIERTAYPRFRRVVSARELHGFYTPIADELSWAQAVTRSDEHLLALVLALKCFQRLAHFPRATDVPEVVVDHVRGCLALGEAVVPVTGTDRTSRVHHDLIRARVGAVHDPERARVIAAAAIREAALVKNNPPDLINVALEELIRGGLELPGFSTLDEMAGRIRSDVNSEIFDGILARMSPDAPGRLDGLLDVGGPSVKSAFDRLKRSARRASWSRFKEQVAQLAWVDSLGQTDAWLEGVAPSKVADFAGEAAAADAGVMRDYADSKRIALLACLLHSARARARDDLAEMFCKRVASMTKNAKAQLDAIREQQRAITERLIANYRDILEQLDPDSDARRARERPADDQGGRRVR